MPNSFSSLLVKHVGCQKSGPTHNQEGGKQIATFANRRMRSLEQWYVASPEQHGSGMRSFLRGLVHGDPDCEDGSSRETEVSPDTVAEAGSIVTTVRGSQYMLGAPISYEALIGKLSASIRKNDELRSKVSSLREQLATQQQQQQQLAQQQQQQLAAPPPQQEAAAPQQQHRRPRGRAPVGFEWDCMKGAYASPGTCQLRMHARMLHSDPRQCVSGRWRNLHGGGAEQKEDG